MLLNSEDSHGFASETTFSDHPLSELTFNGSAGSKKRTYMESRVYGSSVATTSGPAPAAVVPPFTGDVEIDALIQFQTKQLQSGMELLSRKHSRYLVSAAEQEVTKRLRIKEMELEYVSERNRELEEQVKQMAAEIQVWFNYAKTTEALVASLKAKLDQVLINQIPCSASDVEDGYDHSSDSSPAGEAESGCEPDEGRWSCRVCQEREACVLLLPCRHLCLCNRCEANIDACPVCNCTRNASIQVVVT